MDRPQAILTDRMRRGPRGQVVIAFGVVAVLLAAVIVAACRSCAGEDTRTTQAVFAADGVPGFHGGVPDSSDPVRDGAPPVAPAPLAGAATARTAVSRAVYALADHPLFARHVGLERVSCALPQWRDDPAAAREFYRAAIDCLDASWEPTLRGAGLPFRSPRLLVSDRVSEVGATCAPGSVRTRDAYYCANTETILMSAASPRSASSSRRGAQLAALAHEYGHHVQTVIGVTRAYQDKRAGLGWDSAAGQEQGRRMELQAGCFSGVFLGTNVGRGDIDERTWAEAAVSNREAGDRPGQARVHGSDADVWGWWKWGSDTGDTWECNTWYAAPVHVD
ncbi:neutral zinc metallopeptidase [Nocardia arizonensis]|uniref:neutral zinc metallopeptidase n=1 Tax=Nocardia arizonensis TaxID=1141647 RepID=UPI0006CF5C12|nr:neutral zinc metallopeptidase [Nocardia arizonensis]